MFQSANEPHPDLMGSALVLVGHHGYREIGEHQIILDVSGGNDDLALEVMTPNCSWTKLFVCYLHQVFWVFN